MTVCNSHAVFARVLSAVKYFNIRQNLFCVRQQNKARN